jgi:two-component system, chemotaxis family, CheB/CheR fusion protein
LPKQYDGKILRYAEQRESRRVRGRCSLSQEIAHELETIARHPYVKQRPARDGDEVKFRRFPEEADALTKVFYLIKQRRGVNFADYKHSTLQRRLARRMVLRQVEDLEDYVRLLRSDANEVEQLFNDILINVTSFFRDPAAFATLQKKIFPKIIKAKEPRGEIRIWVPGCSTGEEIYSVTIAAVEALGRRTSNIRLQVFGTNLSEQIIARARRNLPGIDREERFPRAAASLFHENFEWWLSNQSDHSRHVHIRATECLRGSSFSHIDVITCRNLLIYLGPKLQRNAFPLFTMRSIRTAI